MQPKYLLRALNLPLWKLSGDVLAMSADFAKGAPPKIACRIRDLPIELDLDLSECRRKKCFKNRAFDGLSNLWLVPRYLWVVRWNMSLLNSKNVLLLWSVKSSADTLNIFPQDWAVLHSTHQATSAGWPRGGTLEVSLQRPLPGCGRSAPSFRGHSESVHMGQIMSYEHPSRMPGMKVPSWLTVVINHKTAQKFYLL